MMGTGECSRFDDLFADGVFECDFMALYYFLCVD